MNDAPLPPQSVYLVGLTGGVGSGKTTAAALFAAKGVYVVDVDDLSRALTAPGGSAVSAVAAAFPDAMRDGEIDRAALRARVFSSAQDRKKLEAILHPLIRIETRRSLSSANASAAPYTLLVVPLLFESNAYADQIECAVVVDVAVETQINRVVATRGVPREIADGIVAAQMTRAARLQRAQFVLDNGGPVSTLATQVDALHTTLVANAVAARRASQQPMEAVA